MTVLLMAGEKTDLSGVGVYNPNWTAGAYGYARGSLSATAVHFGLYQPASEFWFSYYTNYIAGDGLCFTAGGGIARTAIRFRISDWTGLNNIQLFRCNTSGDNVGAALASAPGINSYPAGSKIDVNFKFAAAGFCKVYYDGVLILDYVGDTRGTSVEDTITGVYATGRAGAYTSNLWEFIAHTSDTRKMRLATLTPNAAGDVNTFTGTYADVDESGAATTTDNLITNEAGAQFALGLSNLAAPPVGRGSWKVHAIRTAVNAMATPDATPQKLKVGVRSGGVMMLSAAQALQSGYLNIHHIIETNPTTGLPLTPAEIDALQIAGETAV